MTADPLVAEIPAELRERQQWVCWRYVVRDGKRTKPPYQINGELASSTNPTTWTTFAAAIEALKAGAFEGVGFVLTSDDSFAAFDLDHCRDADTGEIAAWAWEIVTELESYTEITPSGEGLRVLVRATLPPGGRKKGDLEVYDEARYVTLTRRHVEGTPATIEERQQVVERIHAHHFEPLKPESQPREAQPVALDDAALLDRARNAKNGADFERLWRGEWSKYGSQSEADLALCNGLTFWAGGDGARIDRLFRQSGLMREKWDRRSYSNGETYGEHTIRVAVGGATEFYTAPMATTPSTNGSRADGKAGVEVPPPTSLPNVLEVFGRWLHLPDADPVLAVLGAVGANLLQGDPVWLLLIGAPGSGKTEALQSTRRIPRVYPAATMTEAALLSGTSRKERAADARGGLLRQIGDFGIIMAKDFGSVLSMHRNSRGSLLAALREVYDGEWTRHLGVDGGRTLSWSGKVGLIGGCTPSIDSHHAVIASMGERFLMCRLPAAQEDAQARRALTHRGHEAEMRQELQAAVAGLFVGDLPEPEPLSEADTEHLVNLSVLVTRCRSAIERDSYRSEITLIPGPEAPARLVTVLAQLFAGLRAIGCDLPTARRVISRVAMDSMPAIRRQMLEALAGQTGAQRTRFFADATGYPTGTTHRTLEDLTAHGVAVRSHALKGNADVWCLSEWGRQHYQAACCPEMSLHGCGPAGPLINPPIIQDDFSGQLRDGTPDDTCQQCGSLVENYDSDGNAWCAQHRPSEVVE